MFGVGPLAKKFAARLDGVGNEWKDAARQNTDNHTNLALAEKQHTVGTMLCVLAGIVREVFEVA